MTISSSPINLRILKGLQLLLLLLLTDSVNAQVLISDFKPFKYQLEETYSPVTAIELEKEVAKVIEAQKGLSKEDIRTINYWNTSYPSYRWHQIMMEVSRAKKGHKNGGRVVILHLSIYDALAEVWKHKKQHQVKAPYQQNSKVQKLSRERAYSTFVCEWSAAAGAAREVIGYYFPDRKPYLDSLIAQFKETRLITGLQLPSDIEKGMAIGKQIAAKYIEYAKTDRTDRMWEGQVLERVHDKLPEWSYRS